MQYIEVDLLLIAVDSSPGSPRMNKCVHLARSDKFDGSFCSQPHL